MKKLFSGHARTKPRRHRKNFSSTTFYRLLGKEICRLFPEKTPSVRGIFVDIRFQPILLRFFSG
ncbi:hypothetical protein ABH19_02185 [Leptospirillum sp. Group II 'CF-1']|nr:hypothetical protein ABH19_02185 [Leptospirillum sp. Group II 'CF-1']